jgi:hypothetical protein
MRITRDTLLKLARDTVKQRVAADHNLIAAYLVGSTLTDDPFLGGSADVDIIFLCIRPPAAAREIVRVSPEVHLDLYYYVSTDFEPPRKLRTDPLLGYVIYAPTVLYDTRHFLEYAQAIVRAQFDDPPNVLARVRHHSEPARQLWMDLDSAAGEPRAQDVLSYLQSVEHAAQAFAIFDGQPLTERRFLVEFAGRQPGLVASLYNLVGGLAFDPGEAAALLPDWEASFSAAAREGDDLSIHPLRLNYYKHAITSLLSGEAPSESLWPLVHSWTVAAASLASYSDEVKAWHEVFGRMGLAGEGFEYRLRDLDHFLDRLEEKCDAYAAEYSLEQE